MEEAGAGRYLTELNQRLRKGWTAHLSQEGRIYYMSHETRMSSWLPPVESWDSGESRLPYGWEEAVDEHGKTYYINHASKTCVRERPRREEPGPCPQPRSVVLTRDPQVGFGFVAGSERPVIVRFVTEGGPNEGSLLPGDQILQINGEDVQRAPRERVIELIRSCKQTVTLLVCQPQTSNGARKSALLTAAKKERLKSNPPRVRFSEGVVINGSPLYSPSPVDVPFLPNVLKVFLENGQTKSFKYDSTTTVQDVLNSLFEKLSLRCTEHFSLATEHVKIARKNRLTVLDPAHTLAKIAARPGSHHLRCVFRVSFVPRDAYDLLQKDQAAFEYLYLQCCNDVVQERFAPELKYDVALRLAALHIHQHCLSSSPSSKITVKAVERECGLEPFVPVSLRESMKRKELRKVLGHCLKQAAQALCAPGQRRPTPLQAKLHYLKVVAELPSYGSKCFSTNIKDSNPEIALLVSPRFGISQIACLRSTHPVVLARIEELSEVKVSKEDEISSAVELFMKDPDKQSLEFSMEDRDVDEFLLMMRGYFQLLAGKELPVQRDCGEAPSLADTVPCFPGRHTVLESPWSYPPGPNRGARSLDLTLPPPPYVPAQHEVRHLREKNAHSPTRSVDFNMNENPPRPLSPPLGRRLSIPRTMIDERHPGIDYQSVISMELLEDSAGDVDVDVYEAKNEEVIRRITEMSRILDDVEGYMDDSSLLLENEKNQKMQQSFEDPPADDPQQIEEEVSPSESDTDSTPNVSPLHRNLPQRNSVGGHHRPVMRRDSSFGLHSPDLLPDLSSGNNILDILKHLQDEEVPLPFAEETLYLDPDIIDLTMIPPPVTPESGPDIQPGSTPLRDPPTPFLDAETLQEEIDRWIVCPGQPGISVTCQNGMSGEPEHSLESFIASLTVPPPPQPTSEQPLYVIPPPPSSSPSAEVQEQVIARFVALSQDVKRLFEGDDRPGRQSGPESPVPDDVAERRLRCPEGGAPDGSDPSEEFDLYFQTLELDSGSHSGDSSSGYETLFGDPFSADDFSPSPSDPVPPRLKTSCVDEPACLSLTSPSSTTSSDSSVILLDPASPGSCDSLAPPELLSPAQTGLVRSASWTHIIDGQKPTLAPNPFQQNRLRRSFNRGTVRVPPVPRKLPDPQPEGPAHPDEAPSPPFESRGPFDQAQRDLSAMISHLRKLSGPAGARPPGCVDAAQCRAATEALVNESRRFVTSSKMFVKSALDSSGGTVQNMAVCVALLNRMTALGELVLLRSPEPATPVLDRLREVSEAFLRTVAATDTPHLLQRATALATGLTALMRTLRAVTVNPTTA